MKIHVEEKIILFGTVNKISVTPVLSSSTTKWISNERKNVHVQLHIRDVNPLLRKHLLYYTLYFRLRRKSGDVNWTERRCLLAAALQSIPRYNLFKKLDRTSNNTSDVIPLALNPLKARGVSFHSRNGVRLRSYKGIEPTNGHVVRPLVDTLMNTELWWIENWCERNEFLGDKTIPLPLCPINVPRTALGSNLGLRCRKGVTIRVW